MGAETIARPVGARPSSEFEVTTYQLRRSLCRRQCGTEQKRQVPVYAAAQMFRIQLYRLVAARFAMSRILEIQVMLETIAVVLLILWALGLVSSYTMGGFIHLLLVAALVVIVVRVIQGRRV